MAPATLSNLPLQVLIYFNGWYDVVFVLAMFALYIWKGTQLPYDGFWWIFALEVCLVPVLGMVEYCRLFLASRGNKIERSGPLILSCILAPLSGVIFFYFLYLQVYVARADVILSGIGLGFIGLELLISLLVVVSLIRAPPQAT